MTQKTQKQIKSKKLLKITLASVAGLSTLAAVTGAICATSLKSKNSANPEVAAPLTSLKNVYAPVQAAGYAKVTFALSAADITAYAKITGQTVVKIRKGSYFGTIVQPIAEKTGYKFSGWTADGTNLIKDDDQISDDTALTAVFTQVDMIANFPASSTGDYQWQYTSGVTEVPFEDGWTFSQINAPKPEWITPLSGKVMVWDGKWYDKAPGSAEINEILPNTPLTDGMNIYPGWEDVEAGTVVVKGKTLLSLGESTTYEATVYPTTAPQDVDWYVVDDLSALTTPSTHAEIDEDGILTPISKTTDPIYVFAVAAGQTPTDILATDPNVVALEIVDPEIDPTYDDKILTTIEGTTYAMDPAQFYDTTGTITGYALGSETSTDLGEKTAFNNPIVIGKTVTKLADNFMADWTAFDSQITFAEGGLLTHIGDNFLNGTAFDQNLVLPSSLTYIGNFFLADNTEFGTNANTLTLNTGLKHIGDNFLEGCTNFAGSLALPASLTEVGEVFIFDTGITAVSVSCPVYVFEDSNASFAVHGDTAKPITITCTAPATFEDMQLQFPAESGFIKRSFVKA